MGVGPVSLYGNIRSTGNPERPYLTIFYESRINSLAIGIFFIFEFSEFGGAKLQPAHIYCG